MRRLLAFVQGVFASFMAHDALSLAAATAFYTALSFAPLVLLLVSLSGFLGEDTTFELLGQFSSNLGPRSSDLARSVVDAAARRAREGPSPWWHTGLSTAGLLVTSSAVFGQLQASLNRIFGVTASPAEPGAVRGWVATAWMGTRDWLRKRILSMGMVFVVMFILLISLVASTAIAALVPQDGVLKAVARAGEFAASFLVATLLFAAMFKVLPDARIPWRGVWLGAAVTSVLFNSGKLVLSLYIEKAGVGRNYGEAVGGLIALLVWVYYSSAVLLLGATVTHRLGGPVAPLSPKR